MKINNPLQEISRKHIEESIYNRDYRNLVTKILNHNKKFNDNISTNIEMSVFKPEYSPTLIYRGVSSGIEPLHQSTYIRKINK